MTEKWQEDVIRSARGQWDAGDGYEAGKSIVEHIPNEDRKFWAANILEQVYGLVETIPEIESLLNLARNDEKWEIEAQELLWDAKDKVGHVHNALDESAPLLTQEVMNLAYYAGKTIYNARNYRAMYDHNGSWILVAKAKTITEYNEDSDFAEALWETIANRQFMKLKIPTHCNPGCPFCGEMYGAP